MGLQGSLKAEGNEGMGPGRLPAAPPGGLSDAELVPRALDNDESAYETLMNRHLPSVLGLLASKARVAEDVEDLAQETFLQAFRFLGDLRDPGKFGGWVRAIALRNVTNFYRSPFTRARKLAVGDPEAVLSQVATSRPGPRAQLSAATTHQVVLAEIEKLGQRYRAVVNARLINEEMPAETARRLGLRPEEVRMLLFRGLKKLRVALRRKGVSWGGAPRRGDAGREGGGA
jgi:RNA polymerase sigma-70 factor (ECF subfamily)